MCLLWQGFCLTQLQGSMLSVQTHPLHTFLRRLKCFWACCRLVFLHSRSVVLAWGHTPGEHAQCHKTPKSHIQTFHFLIWVDGYCPLPPIYGALHDLTVMLALCQWCVAVESSQFAGTMPGRAKPDYTASISNLSVSAEINKKNIS